MRVVASGVVFDTRAAPINERSASSSAALALADGTILASFRLGTERESGDGHAALFASRDLGATWELRYLGLAERTLNGVRGETRGMNLAELTPGEITASTLWTDRSDPSKPWVNQQTQGLLPMLNYHSVSRDGGHTWTAPRVIDLSPHPSASTTGPILRLGGDASPSHSSTGSSTTIRPSAGRGRCCGSRTMAAARGRTRRSSRPIRPTASTTGTSASRRTRSPASSWRCSGRSTARPMRTCRSTSPGHARRPAMDGARRHALDGQHCQPVAIGGDDLVAVYSHRRNPPGCGRR